MDLILHHYPLSPFSEKIRSMLGFAQIEWRSCLTSEAPPRGKLDLLTGGYSRIPVAQIGADIFCDTNIIAEELASMSDQPPLSLSALDSTQMEQLRWFETKLFFACVNKAFSLSLLKRIAKEKGVLNLGLFLKDRIQMGAKASISLGSPRSAPKYIAQGIDTVSTMLSSQPFIGGEHPDLLDFAAYHCFWFLKEVGERNDIDRHPKLLSWYRKMLAFNDGETGSIQTEEALSIARNASPRDLDPTYLSDLRIGSSITISPSDYRQIPVMGTLVGVSEERWIIKIEQAETGPLHLHFPTHSVNVTIRLDNEL